MNETENIKGIVFDMDGVLFDSERISLKAWERAGEEIGFHDWERAHRECTGLSRTDAYVKLAELYGPNFPAQKIREKASEYFYVITAESGLPQKYYAKEILEYLKGKGYPLALASSTRRQIVERELKEGGLYDFFDFVIGGDDVTHSKPHPEIYQLACKGINVLPQEAVAIEDSINGILSAHAAGMKCVMVPDQIQPEEKTKNLLYKLCDTLEDIKNFL